MENKCGICYIDIDVDNKITLKCKHIFCYDCIFDWFKEAVNKYDKYNKISKRECPYCRNISGILPIKDGYPLIHNVNTSNDNIYKCIEYTKKGKKCNNKALYVKKDNIFTLCYIHNKSTNSSINKPVKISHNCNALTLKGLKCKNNGKYKIDNNYYCSTHKEKHIGSNKNYTII